MKPFCTACLFLLLASGLLVPTLSGQIIEYPYYGKNRVIYESFPWRSYKTAHFEIYFYHDNPERLKILAGMCESAYKKVSSYLKHELSKPVPLIYYLTFTDFEQSNIFHVSEGVLGVSEPILFRTGVHGDMPLDELQTLIIHELTHVFEFDILWGSQGGALTAIYVPPLWTFEGLSEFNTHRWSPWSKLLVRDAVLNDRLPDLDESGEMISRFPLPRDPAYDFGHALYEYIAERFGPSAIRELWASLKTKPLLGKKDPFKRAFNVPWREFSSDFKKYLRQRAKPFRTRESPEDYSFPLGPEYPINPYYFAFSHALSPSGEIVATITYNAQDYDIDIVLLSAKDGTILKNITKGYTTRYEYIKFEIEPSLGRNLAWSPEGDRLAFFARHGRRHSLFIIEAFSGKTVAQYNLAIDQPNGPCFTPDGQHLLLTGFEKGVHDIFRFDLKSGELVNLTKNDLYEKAPAISPDGRWLAFTLRVDDCDKIFIAPMDDLSRRKQYTFGPGNTICPVFSPDGKTLYFSGDMREANNIYSLDLETGEVRRYTDVQTGNFYPEPVRSQPGRILFSSFNKGSFQIFRTDLSDQAVAEEGIGPAAGQASESTFHSFEPILSVDIQKEKIEPYKGMGQLYVTSRPPIDAVVSSDGSIYGGSALAFSDLMGDHLFSVLAYQVRSFRSYDLSYLNQRGRLQWMLNAYQYTLFYYPDYATYDPYVYNTITYSDAIAQRQMTGLQLLAYYPLNLYSRLQGGLGYLQYEEDYLDPYLMRQVAPRQYAQFLNGHTLLASFSLVGETTHFKAYGPAQGATFRLTVSQSLPLAKSFLRYTNLEADLRRYLYIGSDFLLAFRWVGFASLGRDVYFHYYGGNNQVRSAYYYNLVATQGWYFNAEFRFPLVAAASTVIGLIGPIRGVLFFDITQAKIKGFPSKFYVLPEVYGAEPQAYDALGSFGFGFETFLLGWPIHIEFAKRLYFPRALNPLDYVVSGNYEAKFWIGFDF
jgi:WD40 repeat protein